MIKYILTILLLTQSLSAVEYTFTGLTGWSNHEAHDATIEGSLTMIDRAISGSTHSSADDTWVIYFDNTLSADDIAALKAHFPTWTLL